MLQTIKKIPIIRVLALPKHLNPSGTIFGGWLISKMDLAGGISAWDIASGKIRTVRCDNINFIKPVHVADVISYYTETLKIKNSSIKIKVIVEIDRVEINKNFRALDGIFTYVAIDNNGKSRDIDCMTNNV